MGAYDTWALYMLADYVFPILLVASVASYCTSVACRLALLRHRHVGWRFGFLGAVAAAISSITFMMLVLGVYATRDSLRPRLARQAVSGVHIRDARSQVIAARGRPARTRPVVPIKYLHLGSPQPVLWCYGRKYDWHHPFSRRFPYII